MPNRAPRPLRSATLLLASIWAILAFCGALSGALSPASAQEPAPVQGFSNYSGTGPGPSGPTEVRSQDENDRLYQSLKGFLMSPYCPGLTLGSCGSGAAELLRADLHEWVDAGYTREEIVRYYASTFGEEFLGRPPFRGSAIVVWVAPIVALLLGLVAVTLFIRRASKGKSELAGPEPGASRPSIDPETEARLEAEVKAHYS